MGTNYAWRNTPSLNFRATNNGVDTLTITAIVAGVAQNGKATTETCANAAWGGAVTAGGTAGAQFYGTALSSGVDASGLPTLSFYGAAKLAKGAVTGAKAGNVALTNLLIYLDARGLLTNSTT